MSNEQLMSTFAALGVVSLFSLCLAFFRRRRSRGVRCEAIDAGYSPDDSWSRTFVLETSAVTGYMIHAVTTRRLPSGRVQVTVHYRPEAP
jgi:hypothetical protein